MSTRRFVFTAESKFAVSREAGKPVTLSGYAIVWNVLSSDRGGYFVRLAPGSAQFETPMLALRDHDFSKVLGNTANSTLRIIPDDYGVKVEIDLPATTLGNDTATEVEGRYVTGMSFSMSSMPVGQTVRENGVEILDVTGFTCDEVTITANPAFTQTSIGVKTDDAKFCRIARDSTTQLQKQKFDEIRLGLLAA